MRERKERGCDEDRVGKKGTRKRGRERRGTVAGRSNEATNLPELNPRIFFARRTATLARHLGLVSRGTWSGHMPERDSMSVYEIQTTLWRGDWRIWLANGEIVRIITESDRIFCARKVQKREAGNCTDNLKIMHLKCVAWSKRRRVHSSKTFPIEWNRSVLSRVLRVRVKHMGASRLEILTSPSRHVSRPEREVRYAKVREASIRSTSSVTFFRIVLIFPDTWAPPVKLKIQCLGMEPTLTEQSRWTEIRIREYREPLRTMRRCDRKVAEMSFVRYNPVYRYIAIQVGLNLVIKDTSIGGCRR